MKDHCLELVARQPTASAKYNILREYAQAYVLKIMQEAGALRSYAFVGGTALRFLYDLPRFSEDLDFSSIASSEISLEELMRKIKRELLSAGYHVEVTCNEGKTVSSAFIKFEGLLFEAGLSPVPGEKFSVKVEVDTRPPDGAVLTTRVTNKFFPLAFISYDLPSLFAGKIHAVMNRKYVKGRDYYDLAWYLSREKGLQPNITFLAAALKQTGWKGKPVNLRNWRSVLSAWVEKADWKIVDRDVTSFLERPSDMQVFSKENVLKLIRAED